MRTEFSINVDGYKELQELLLENEQILAKLQASNLTIQDLSTHEVELEDLFVALTSSAA